MHLALRLAEPDRVRLEVDVPGDEGRAPLEDQVGLNVVRVDVLDHLGRQREEAEPVGRPAPVAVQPHLLEADHERVARLGPLDEERPGRAG